MLEWLSDGSSVLVASEPTTSTDSDFLGIVSDTLFSGEHLHTWALIVSQERKEERQEEREKVLKFVSFRSHKWNTRQNLFLTNANKYNVMFYQEAE